MVPGLYIKKIENISLTFMEMENTSIKRIRHLIPTPKNTAYVITANYQPDYHPWLYDISWLRPGKSNLSPKCDGDHSSLNEPWSRNLFFIYRCESATRNGSRRSLAFFKHSHDFNLQLLPGDLFFKKIPVACFIIYK